MIDPSLRLPLLFVERIHELVVGAEVSVVSLGGVPGEGAERLLARWSKEPYGLPARAVDLDSADALARARETLQSRGATSSAAWFLVSGAWPRKGDVLSQIANVSDWLLPGERLVLSALNATEEQSLEAESNGLVWCLPEGTLALQRAELDQLQSEHSLGEEDRRILDNEQLDALLSMTRGRLYPIELALRSENPETWLRRPLEDPLFSGYLQRIEELRLRRQRGSLPAQAVRPVLDFGSERTTTTMQPSGELPTLRVELLGRPQVLHLDPSGGERELLNWGYQAVLEVLAMLMIAPERASSRDELLRRIWPEMNRKEALKQLYPAISHLRRLLAPMARGRAVLWSKGVYRLAPSLNVSADVVEVELALQETRSVGDDLLLVQLPPRSETASRNLDPNRSGDAGTPSVHDTDQQIETLRAGLRCFRGAFLEGVTNRWISVERERFARTRLVVLRRQASLLARSRRFEELEEALRSLLLLDRGQEDAYIALMRMYSQRGRTDLVRRQYERMCSVLLNEFGVQPMDSTIREAERLLS